MRVCVHLMLTENVLKVWWVMWRLLEWRQSHHTTLASLSSPLIITYGDQSFGKQHQGAPGEHVLTVLLTFLYSRPKKILNQHWHLLDHVEMLLSDMFQVRVYFVRCLTGFMHGILYKEERLLFPTVEYSSFWGVSFKLEWDKYEFSYDSKVPS